MPGDDATLRAYERAPATFADDWEAQPEPAGIASLVLPHFRAGPTLDVGCGSGFFTAWLAARGFDATGVDPSPGLLDEARRRHPGLRFVQGALPALAGFVPATHANVFCKTVIMHLPAALVGPSVQRLVALLAPAGTLYLSWRTSPPGGQRDRHGRLYEHVPPAHVREALAGTQILADEEAVSSSSDQPIHQIVARRP
ncbi:MAG: class I SAM-dependent methyltransferase [Proteobacteria bacterium]|nr:class I SAM-dependent methyltransferase [Pseudomonadota bacterium]